jgi:predicted adenine nucleotide alpha hydrolase (AANH) superfamily ATPase
MTEPALLVHACCGPCLAAVLEPLREVGPFAALFYNPNVQPLLEFRRRLKAVQVLADQEKLPLIVDDRYDPKAFLAGVPWDRPERCLACYRLRLGETARVAAARGIPAFTTTLLASTHQDLAAVRRVAAEAAAEAGVRFHDADWRSFAPRGAEEARRRRLYRQAYCGCLFSEQERFARTTKHLYRGEGGGELVRSPSETAAPEAAMDADAEDDAPRPEDAT